MPSAAASASMPSRIACSRAGVGASKERSNQSRTAWVKEDGTLRFHHDVYDHDDFLETLKKFILARTFARVRVLILEPARVVLSASRFVAMGRRLNSYIEFRRALPELSGHPEAFFIADEQALVYRARAESWEGMSDTYEPAVARMYLSKFESLWNACETEPEVRQLQI